MGILIVNCIGMGDLKVLYLRLVAWAVIAGGFAFGIPERYLAGDYFSVGVAVAFTPFVLMLFPFSSVK